MRVIRTLFGRHRALAMLVMVCALAMKALVPAGYMTAPGAKLLSVQICADSSGSDQLKQIAIPMKGAPAAPQGDRGKAAVNCSYASLAMAALGGADAPLLALALAFILVVALLTAMPPPALRLHLRPPQRGPPLHA